MAMNAAERQDGLGYEHVGDFSSKYPIEDLLAAEYFDDVRGNAELFLQTCIGTSNGEGGKWNLNGCTFKVENGFIFIRGISVMQSDGKGGGIITLCLKYGFNVYADCRKVRGVDARVQRDTFSIVVPVSFLNEVVANSVFTVFEAGGPDGC